MSKLGYIYSSYGKQFNVAIANTNSENVLNGSNLPKNSFIIASNYNEDFDEDEGIYSLIVTDSDGKGVRLSYCIQEGNGLVYDKETDTLSLNIDNKTIVSEKGKLKFDISYFIDNETIKIDDGKLYIDTENLRVASEENYGVGKIDDRTIKISENTIYVNTDELDSSNTSTEMYGIGIGDENTISSFEGKLSVNTQNLRPADGEIKGIVKADEITTSILSGKLSVNTSNLERGINNKYGIVKGDEESIKIQNQMLSVITENLTKSSESNFGIAKIDGRTIQLNSEGSIYMSSYDELISKIDIYKELKEKYDKKIKDIREEIKVSPYQFNRKDIYLFAVNKTSMTELVKPKHMEEVIEMPEQYAIAEFNIITGCDFYISVNYDRFTNEFPPVTLMNINYNDEVEYPNSEGLGINTIYKSTNGEEKKLIFTFWAKNFNNSALDKSLITSIEITISSIEDIGEKKIEKYSIVRYNSNYEIEKEKEEKQEEETYTISHDINESFIEDSNHNIYSLDDIIPWYINNVNLYITGINSKTGEKTLLVDRQSYSLFEYTSKAWQGKKGEMSNQTTYYNDIPISIATPVSINDRLSVISQVVNIKKEVFPPNTVFQLTNKTKKIDLYTYNLEYIKVKERVFTDTNLNFDINKGIVTDKIENYSISVSKPKIEPTSLGVSVINSTNIKSKIENSGYYLVPIIYTGTSYVPNTQFTIAHTNNIWAYPIDSEDHDELLDAYFTNVSLNKLDLNIQSKDIDIEMTYGTSISNIIAYVKSSYSLNDSPTEDINDYNKKNYIPNIYFNINSAYTSRVKESSYISSSLDESYIGYRMYNISPEKNILLNHLYEESNWEITYNTNAYFAYYNGFGYDLNNPNLCSNFNVKINIKSEPYLTVSNLSLNQVNNSNNQIINLSASHPSNSINHVIQTYQINGMNEDTHYITDGEFMLTYKYYITDNSLSSPIIDLQRTEFNENKYSFIYTIQPPTEYYESSTITQNEYSISYTYYFYNDRVNNLGWKTEPAKNWYKYQILGVEKKLTEIKLDKGYVLEAYFTLNDVQKPSKTIYAYAYSILNDNLFNNQQIYSINTDANNNIYFIPEVGEYYLPSNLQNRIIPNSEVDIKIENINNASTIKNGKVNSSKTITINGYIGIEREDNNSYTYFVSRSSTISENDGKYLININSSDIALSTHATISYIYSHPETFSIKDYSISNTLSLDYEIDTSKSPNVFYLFTESSENIYTTKFPLSNYTSPFTSSTRDRVNNEYLANNILWKSLKQLTSSPRMISGSPYPKDSENYSAEHRITVDLPYLDEVGLFDRFFCPLIGGLNSFNQNLICIKVNKDNGVNNKKYYLSTNTDDIVNIINTAVEEHIGYSVNSITEGTNKKLIYKSTSGLNKKSSSDYTLSDNNLYMYENASISQAYRNQWDNIFTGLSTLVDENGNLIKPIEPGPGASESDKTDYQNKIKVYNELQEKLQNTFGSDEVLENFLNRTNNDIQNYSFSKYDDDNAGYDMNYLNREGFEYKFKYVPPEGSDIFDADGIHRTDNIDIDIFVLINQDGHYQDSILKNLMGDEYDYDIAKTNYPLGYKTFELYYKQYSNAYNLFKNSQNLKNDSNYKNNYYLVINNIIPSNQNTEFSLITQKSNISDYNIGNYNTQELSSGDNITNIHALYYSVSNASINDKLRELYNDSEQIYYPTYHYFILKNSIYQKNIKFINDLNIDINYLSSDMPYTNQYSDGSVFYKPELWSNNISELITNTFTTIADYRAYYNTEYTVDENGNSTGTFTNYKYDDTTLFIPKDESSILHKLFKDAYIYQYYFDHFILTEVNPQDIGDRQTEIDQLQLLYADVQSKEGTARANWDIPQSFEYPSSNTYSGTLNHFKVDYTTATPTETQNEQGEPVLSWGSLQWQTVSNRFNNVKGNISDRINDLRNQIENINANNSELSQNQIKHLNIYYTLKTNFDNTYSEFINELSKYNDIVSKINTEANAFYSTIKHEKEILDSKMANLKNEYDSLLKGYLKSKILESYKRSEAFSDSVDIYNQNNKNILDIIQGYQQNTIDMYKSNCLKEVNYVLNILLNDLSNINNANLNIYDASVNLNDINSGTNVSFIDILPEYSVDFNIFDNIKPRFKIFNNYNILYFDNLFSNGNTQYTLKYSIDNRNKMYDTITQADINSHSVFFGTYKYNILDLSNGAYVHVYEYYNNYYVKEIIPPFKLLDIVSISNGFGLEINTNNSNTKYYKVKYNEDSVLSEMIKSGYPEIGYRKNRANIEYDNYEVLYTNSNNISIENNLTLLSLQKNYIVYDNISSEQYICGNREYFIVDPNKNDIIPYYGNMMFSSREFFNMNNQKFAFAQNNPKYIIIDYNLYFASSNYNRSEINENQYEDNDGKYGLKTFNNSLKIFTYIKDYYNENNALPTQSTYTNNLIWKYCKNKVNSSLSYFKLLNYQWVEPGISTGNNSGDDADIINIGG